MAKIGLQNFMIGELTETSNGATYGESIKPGKAISCKVDISTNDAKLYADDGLAESDKSFQSGTVTLGIDDEDITIMATLLGHTTSNGEIVRNVEDVAPYFGMGRIVTKMVNNVRKYKVEFLHKVKFAEPSADESTKGESLEFGTTELSGTVHALANGSWSKAKTFDTMDAAKTYLTGLFGTTTE